MISLIKKTLPEIAELSGKANSRTLKNINSIKKAIKSKNPDHILLPLQKSGELSFFFEYWQSRTSKSPETIKSTINDQRKSVIEIIIDMHILKSINEPTKIIWTNPSIINPVKQSKLILKNESVQNKNPSWKSQSSIADILGVSRQAVQKLCRPGGKFVPALNEKRKINRWHPIIVQHKEDLDARKKNSQNPVKPKEFVQNKTPAISQIKNAFSMEITFEDVEHLTLRQIVETYGGIQGFKNYMDALVKMSEFKTKDQKYEKDRGKLIEKDSVAKALFSIVNAMLSRIVNEYPSSIVDQLFAIAKSGKDTSRIDGINLMREAASSIIKYAKSELIRDLEKLKD